MFVCMRQFLFLFLFFWRGTLPDSLQSALALALSQSVTRRFHQSSYKEAERDQITSDKNFEIRTSIAVGNIRTDQLT